MNLPSNELVIVILRHPLPLILSFLGGILNSETSRWTSFQWKLSFLRKESPFKTWVSAGSSFIPPCFRNLLQSGRCWTKVVSRTLDWIQRRTCCKNLGFLVQLPDLEGFNAFFPLKSFAKKTKRTQNHGIPISLQILLFFSLDSVVMQKMKRTLSTFVRLNPPCFRFGEFPHHVCKVF